MNIATNFNIGDTFWGVHWWSYPADVPCKTCNGNGGATIPGTEVFVKCQTCDGDGETKESQLWFEARHCRVDRVIIRADQQKTETVYAVGFVGCSGYANASVDERHAFQTESEAKTEMDRLKAEAIAKGELVADR